MLLKINMFTNSDIDKIIEYCRKNLSWNLVKGNEFSYSCLPLCAIDALFSINTRYKAVENTVERVCLKWGIPPYAADKSQFPPQEAQVSISAFLEKIIAFSNAEELVQAIYKNRQRTSSKNGILKAEAVTQLLKILQQNEIEYLQDVEKIKDLPHFETQFKAIQGQKSGVSFTYFLMLTGSNHLVKPDRMIIRFLNAATGKDFSRDECQKILTTVAKALTSEYPKLTVQQLDYQIWSFQRKA
jgi:hypothetical protein